MFVKYYYFLIKIIKKLQFLINRLMNCLLYMIFLHKSYYLFIREIILAVTLKEILFLTSFLNILIDLLNRSFA